MQILASPGLQITDAYLADRNRKRVKNLIITNPATSINGIQVFDLLAKFDVPEGFYKVIVGIKCVNRPGIEVFSGCIHVAENHECTKLIEYSHSENDFSVIFDTGVQFALRIEGGFYPQGMNPQSQDTIYQNEIMDFVNLKSVPYETYIFTSGGVRGIPDTLQMIVNRAFSCNWLKIDGVRWSKISGSKWESGRAENYDLRAWKIELTPKETADTYNPNCGSTLTCSAEWSSDLCSLEAYHLPDDGSPGDGTEENPFKIRTLQGYLDLCDQTAAGDNKAGIWYRVHTDIDLNAYPDNNIGCMSGFSGSIDFNYYSISNKRWHLPLSTTGAVFLIYLQPTVGQTIKNLAVYNANLNSPSINVSYASIFGCSAQVAGVVVNLENIRVWNSTIQSGYFGAGLVGYTGSGVIAYSLKISKCSVHWSVNVQSAAAGFVGYVNRMSVTISDSVNRASIRSGETAGGFVALTRSSTPTPQLTRCINYGNITSTNNYAAAGINIAAIGNISTCVNLCDTINGSGTSSKRIGTGNVSDCYAIETILVDGHTVIGSPYDADGGDLDFETSISRAFYESFGYDFENVWDMGGAGPELKPFPTFSRRLYFRQLIYTTYENGVPTGGKTYQVVDGINAEFPAITYEVYESSSPEYVAARCAALLASINKCGSFVPPTRPSVIDFEIEVARTLVEFEWGQGAMAVDYTSTQNGADWPVAVMVRGNPDWVGARIEGGRIIISVTENPFDEREAVVIVNQIANDCVVRSITVRQDVGEQDVIAYDEDTAIGWGQDSQGNEIILYIP